MERRQGPTCQRACVVQRQQQPRFDVYFAPCLAVAVLRSQSRDKSHHASSTRKITKGITLQPPTHENPSIRPTGLLPDSKEPRRRAAAPNSKGIPAQNNRTIQYGSKVRVAHQHRVLQPDKFPAPAPKMESTPTGSRGFKRVHDQSQSTAYVDDSLSTDFGTNQTGTGEIFRCDWVRARRLSTFRRL